MKKEKKLTRNMVQCRMCDDIIESKYRHDFVWCTCKAIFTDGGLDYVRRGGKPEMMIDLSVYE